MEGFRTWSVGLDGGVVTASLPEPLRFPSGPLPEWMGRCASAIRDALRELPIADGTLLEATLAGAPPGVADLGDALLYNVRIPEAQVHGGVRLRRAATAGPGVIQSYRRVPVAAAAEDEDEAMLAALQVPLKGVFELDTARLVWLAVRRVVVGALPAGSARPPGGIELRARLVAESEREPVTTELIERLLDGIRASLQVYAGADLEATARRLAAELKADPAEMSTLLSSPRGAVLADGEHFAAVEVIVTAGARAHLDVELQTVTPDA
ncbi:MAG: hypothetical protein M3Q31_24495 [Actinomycetota bacterium]|nr:hypothetical protein [Actinomycetota bacterium]